MSMHNLQYKLRNAFMTSKVNAFRTPEGLLMGGGTTVGNGIEGWAPSAIFVDTDASSGSQVYVNTGTKTAATWVPLGDYSLLRTVEAHTASDTLTTAESGSAHTTVGAAGAVTFTMPAAVVGLVYFFRVGAAQELRIDPDGTETIALPSTGVQGAAGKYLTANADGESVHVVCDKAGDWSVYGFTGTWTAEA